MNWLKKKIIQWLNIKDWFDLNLKSIEHEHALCCELKILREETSYENTLKNIHDLQQKFDALSDALGISVVSDHVHHPPEPVIVSIRDNGLFGNASDYIEAVVAAKKIVSLNYKLMRDQLQLLSTIANKKATDK